MIDFIISSSICLSIFLAAYHLLLEKEKMHNFNRFYLLSSMVISLLIPFLNFEIIKEIPVEVSETVVIEGIIPSQVVFIEEEPSIIPLIIWSLYGLITFGLFIRFGKNILELVSKAKSNPTVKYQNANLVLLDEKVLPHTFWNSIFINFDDYNRRNIEDELYTHELVHVNQKHTFDILFVETLKTIFWFNPLFYFYKKAIQLNHEFLADEEVVKSCDNVPFYQTLLLQKTSINQVFLTSNLNYLVTKKRLIMMTKNTSKTLALLKKIAILPILAALIYFFCVEIVAQEKKVSDENYKTKNHTVAYATSETNKKTNKNNLEEYFKDVRIKYYDKLILVEEETKAPNTVGAKYPKLIFDKKYQELSKEEKEDIEISLILSMQKPLEKKSPSQQELKEFQNSKKFAIWIDGKNVANSELNKYKAKDFAYYSVSVILKNARTKKHPQPFQYWFYTQPYFEKQNIGKNKDKYPGDEIVIFKEGRNQIITPTEKSAVKTEVISSVEEVVSVAKNEKPKTVVVGKYDETPTYIEKNKTEKLEVVAIGKETDLEIPTFPGGISEFYKFVAKNFKMPKNFNNKEKLIVSFIVEKDGSLSTFDVKKDLGSGTKKEAIRVLKNSPKWIPAKVKNETVRYQYVLPIQMTKE
ncbi:M56 family metallopeptidase [Flavobacterium dankookense]|uniref:Beta-lactamase regulating signal transducer with metallopeptidase domain n=1 Tax=Flavobacterium dankookense TaxID=706186 RepID=A0A4R6QAD4_9FLAO|nr:M56 family metallopeptidase [Flavobacterium dankookense]TDP58703.1 beta-lactamase regulating signal transducer with metallopeptidase domain [Flavobacterium dankookense]